MVDNDQTQPQFNNLGALYNPMMMGFGSPLGMGMLGGMYGQGIFLPKQIVNPWIYQPGFSESTYKYLTGLNLPYGVGETELQGASRQSFFDILGTGGLAFLTFAAANAVGDIAVPYFFRPPPAPPDAGLFQRWMAHPLLSPKNFALNAGVFAAVSAIANHSILEPFERNIKLGETYRQALMPAATFSENYDPLRGGLLRSQMQILQKDISHMAARDYYFDQSEYTSIVLGAATTGILDFAKGDTRQIEEAIKSLAKGLKFYAQLAKDPNIIDSMKELAELSNMGVNVNELVTVGTRLALATKQSGYVYSQIAPYATQFSQQFMGTGVSPIHAQFGFTESLATSRALQLALKAEGNPMLGAFGGLEGIQQQFLAMPTGIAGTPLGALALYSGLTSYNMPIQSLLGNMSVDQYMNLTAFRNTYTSLAMKNPQITGQRALLQAIGMAKSVTGGPTPLALIKTIGSQLGLTDQQVDLLLEDARSREEVFGNELTSFNNVGIQAQLEAIEENYPSAFRRIGAAVATAWNVTKDPGRYIAIGWQKFIENSQREVYDYLRDPNRTKGFLPRILTPVITTLYPAVAKKAALIDYDLSDRLSKSELIKASESEIDYFLTGEGSVSEDLTDVKAAERLYTRYKKESEAIDNYYGYLGVENASRLDKESLYHLRYLSRGILHRKEEFDADELNPIMKYVDPALRKNLIYDKKTNKYRLDYKRLQQEYGSVYNNLMSVFPLEDKAKLGMPVSLSRFYEDKEALARHTAAVNMSNAFRTSVLDLLEDDEFVNRYITDKTKAYELRNKLITDENLTLEEQHELRMKINSIIDVEKLNRDHYDKHYLSLTLVAGRDPAAKSALQVIASSQIVANPDYLKEGEFTAEDRERTHKIREMLSNQYKNIIERQTLRNEIYSSLDPNTRSKLNLQAQIMKDSVNNAFTNALLQFAEGDALRVVMVNKEDVHPIMYEDMSGKTKITRTERY